MRSRVDQYQNEIFMSGCDGASLIDIRFNGAFIGDLFPEGHVSMGRNRILISNVKGYVPSDLFMNYQGSFNIRRIYAYFNGKSVPVPVRRHSDEIERIFGKWDKSEVKYEDYNKSFQYFSGGESLLSYVKKGKRYYLTGKSRVNFLPTFKESSKILSNLIAKRSE